MRDAPRKPSCAGCPHDFRYSEPVPMRAHGVMMHIGEHFCIGGKKARRFKRSDPVTIAPDWCPRRKNPCELRVYSLKSANDMALHMMLCRDMGKGISPEERRYAVAHELHTPLTPRDFWARCGNEASVDLLSVEAELYDVVEIDDGLKPVFFYKSETGYKIAPFFHGEIARKNKLED